MKTGRDARNGASSTWTVETASSDYDDDKDDQKPGLCCLQGCLAATSVGVSFFLALPTGIILTVLSVNDDSTSLLAVGCVLIVLPVIVLLIVIFLCLNQSKLPRLKFWKKKTNPSLQTQGTQKAVRKDDINSNTIVLKSVHQLRSPSSIPSCNSPAQLNPQELSSQQTTNTHSTEYRVQQ